MIKLKKDFFTVKVKLGGERLRARIIPERALLAMAQADDFSAQGAVQLLTDLFGAENTQKVCDYYGGRETKAASELLPKLLKRVLNKSLKMVKKSQKKLAKKYL